MKKCKICGKEFKRITASHVAQHGITLEEYKNMPETPDDVSFEIISDEEINEKLDNSMRHKETIMKILKKKYPDIESNVFLNCGNGFFAFDFVSQKSKVAFMFDEAFWHNVNIISESQAYKNLKSMGWKIKTNMPIDPDVLELML